MLSVQDVARQLDVSPRWVRHLLEAGELRGQRVGGAWLIRDEDLVPLRHAAKRRGRRWHPDSAWAVLAALGGEASGLELRCAPDRRSRAHSRAEEGMLAVLPELVVRANVRRYRVRPELLASLRDDQRLVLSGVSAARQVGGNLLAGDEVEGYVKGSDLEALEWRYQLDFVEHPHNVVLHVVNGVWPFAPEARRAAAVVVAADLLENWDERARRAGQEILSAL